MSTDRAIVTLLLALALAGCDVTNVPSCIDADGDGWSDCDEDCDDDPRAHPGLLEIECNDLDENCDGIVLVGLDMDQDGYGVGCGHNEDCDDYDPDRHPGREELCNGVEDNCDGALLEGEGTDADGDGILACEDCWDEDPELPLIWEDCDGLDSDCSGAPGADETDEDGDGWLGCEECDDGDPEVFPGAEEICNGLDDDCDGVVDEMPGSADEDGDGFEGCADCDEGDWFVNIDAPEVCDGVDTDCDGLVDEEDPDLEPDHDGDGYAPAGCGFDGLDCDDRDKHVFPDDIYTSGVVPDCLPILRPGDFGHWDYARISLPSLYRDPETGTRYLYFRGHHDQAEQAIGVAWSLDGVSWQVEDEPLLEPTIWWDGHNLSNPTVVKLPPSFARRWLMLYHARATEQASRQIGAATATDPLGPFERRRPEDGGALTQPVLTTSDVAGAMDADRVLHPALRLDGDLLHLWYNGGAPDDPLLRVFHATSTDGVSWERTDEDGLPGPDVIYEPMFDFHGEQTAQVSWLEDPAEPGAFEFHFTADERDVGTTRGTEVAWEDGIDFPVLSPAADCHRMDGLAVTARGIEHDPLTDSYTWYYGAQTDVAPQDEGGTCPGNQDDRYTWMNGSYVVSYVARGVNHAPRLTVAPPTGAPGGILITGTVRDTAPDQVLVSVSSSRGGALGDAVVDPAPVSGLQVQSTSWSFEADGLTGGSHLFTVTALDEAGVERQVQVTGVVF